MLDTFGIEILPTDLVCVTSWGYGARSKDCGTKSVVIRLNGKSVVIADADGQDRRVGPGNLAVQRRDGKNGHEGNRTCTCGAQYLRGCFCGLNAKQFMATPGAVGV